MAYKLANHPLTMVSLVGLVAVLAFFAVSRLQTWTPETPSVSAPTVFESSAERTTRLGQEQSAKEWDAAQKRADARNQARAADESASSSR